MFRRITFWLSGGKTSEGKGCGKAHRRPDEKRKKRRPSRDRDETEPTTHSVSNDANVTPVEHVEVEIIKVRDRQRMEILDIYTFHRNSLSPKVV